MQWKGITLAIFSTIILDRDGRDPPDLAGPPPGKHDMIHYTCDLCHRKLDAEEDVRYVVKMEVFPVIEGSGHERQDDRDHLLELHETLERLVDAECDIDLDDDMSRLPLNQTLQFDLCPQCRRQFSRHPLGRDLGALLDVSKN